MTRKCFFLEYSVAQGEKQVTLTGPAAHHVSTVLRLRTGDSLELRDGHGRGWQGVITAMEDGKVLVEVKGDQAVHNESPLELSLALAYSRSDRMDLVLRQATELGVHRFLAFRAQRSQYGLSGSQEKKRRERWLKIAREALCQCERTRLPEIMLLSNVSECISTVSCWERNEKRLLKILALEKKLSDSLLKLWQKVPACQELLLVVGPEGGWTENETTLFTEAGFDPIRLGPRTLRLETATTAFLASVQLLWGDLSH